MKRNCIYSILIYGGLCLFTSCNNTPSKEQIVQLDHDNPVDSSVLVLAQPTNGSIIGNYATVTADSGFQVVPLAVTGQVTYDKRQETSISSRITGRVEHLYVHYNYQAVRKGQLLFEIYSPELVSAQREMLLLRSGDNPSLLASSKRKLRYLGLRESEIEQVLKQGTPNYQIPIYSPRDGFLVESINAKSQPPISATSLSDEENAGMNGMPGTSQNNASGTSMLPQDNSPVLLQTGQYVQVGQKLFTIYTSNNLLAEFAVPPALSSFLYPGKKILFHPTDHPAQQEAGQIGLILPTYQTGQNFNTVRVYLHDQKLPVGSLLNGLLAISSQEGTWIPMESVISVGGRDLVFRKVGPSFLPVSIKKGIRAGQMVQVLSPISGWQIAREAAYLVDSESFIVTDEGTL